MTLSLQPFNHQVILIIGASGGIGLLTAQAAAARKHFDRAGGSGPVRGCCGVAP